MVTTTRSKPAITTNGSWLKWTRNKPEVPGQIVDLLNQFTGLDALYVCGSAHTFGAELPPVTMRVEHKVLSLVENQVNTAVRLITVHLRDAVLVPPTPPHIIQILIREGDWVLVGPNGFQIADRLLGRTHVLELKRRPSRTQRRA